MTDLKKERYIIKTNIRIYFFNLMIFWQVFLSSSTINLIKKKAFFCKELIWSTSTYTSERLLIYFWIKIKDFKILLQIVAATSFTFHQALTKIIKDLLNRTYIDKCRIYQQRLCRYLLDIEKQTWQV